MKRLWNKWIHPTQRKEPGADRPTRCLVDGCAWLNLRGATRADPKYMIGALQRLGRMASREKVEMEVFFDGEPLRKAADGESFDGVQVWYAEDRAALEKAIRTRARAARRQKCILTLITDHPELERDAAGVQADCLRPSTLHKTMEGLGGGEDKRRNSPGNRDRSGHPRGGRHRRRGRKTPPTSSENAPRPTPSDQADPVRTLIDVVE